MLTRQGLLALVVLPVLLLAISLPAQGSQPPPPSTMSVALDASSSLVNAGCTSGTISWNHTVSGLNRVLIVAVVWTDPPLNSGAPAVSYNGTTMLQVLTTGNADSVQMHVYRLVSPATGTNPVQIVPTGGFNVIYAAAVSFTGATGTAYGDIRTTTPGFSISSRSLSTTLLSGDMALGFAATKTSVTISATGGQTIQATGSKTCSGTTLEVKAATHSANTMSWSYSPAAEDAASILAIQAGVVSNMGVTTISVTNITSISALVNGRIDSLGPYTNVDTHANSSPASSQSCVGYCGPHGNDEPVPINFTFRLTGLAACTSYTAWVIAEALAPPPTQNLEGAHISFNTTGCGVNYGPLGDNPTAAMTTVAYLLGFAAVLILTLLGAHRIKQWRG